MVAGSKCDNELDSSEICRAKRHNRRHENFGIIVVHPKRVQIFLLSQFSSAFFRSLLLLLLRVYRAADVADVRHTMLTDTVRVSVCVSVHVTRPNEL